EYATFQPIAAARYTILVSGTGLLAGGTFNLQFNGTTYAGTGTFSLPSFLPGSYSVAVPYAYDNSSSLVRFLPETVSTTLGGGSGGTYTLGSEDAWINITFAIQYALEISVNGGGTSSPGPGIYWESSGNTTALTALPGAGQVFESWTGEGAGSVNSTRAEITPQISGAIVELATFGPAVPQPPATFTLTVVATGVPTGATWWITVGSSGIQTSGPNATLSGLNGTYVINAPTVPYGVGERLASNLSNESKNIRSNLTIDVSFAPQLLLTVLVGSGGTGSPGTIWETIGTRVTLSATPNAGFEFVNWTGQGAGNYSGTEASPTITVNGPISESALFRAVTSTCACSSPSGSDLALPVAVILGLLVVGLAGGAILSRRRGRNPPEGAVEESTSGGADGEGVGAETDGGTPVSEGSGHVS
ncbi:MAG: hypothetical protein L3K03_08565, partial [Thermoplasmata archaeon]|nr:hypothetical protein [Thermoplasmata archaeon]